MKTTPVHTGGCDVLPKLSRRILLRMRLMLFLPMALLQVYARSFLPTTMGSPKTSAFLQQDTNYVTVAGRVVEAKDPPLPLQGAVVRVKENAGINTITNANGAFELDRVPVNSTIVITMVGRKPKEYVVYKQQLNLIFSMEENLSDLDQVIVTGYTTQKVRDIAGAVSTINSKNLENKPVVQLSQALQGGTTGINVQQTSGLVGGDQASITIRSIATVGSAAPLVLVDGVPMDMNNIDPSTVASISVLKDAASTALYGARGANGVILVTTKRGKAGVIQASYNGYYGLQQPTYWPKFVDAATYMQLENTKVINGGGQPVFTQGAIDSTASRADPVNYPDYNWADYSLRRNLPIQSHSLMVSGGNTTARFVINVNHTEEQGQLKQLGPVNQSDYSRTTATINTTVDLSNSFIVYTDIFASRSDKTEPYINNDGRNTSFFYQSSLYVMPPNVEGQYPQKPASQLPSYIKPGTNPYYGNFGQSWNPAQILQHSGTFKSARDLVQLNLRPQWTINSKFKLNGQIGYNVQSGEDITSQQGYTFFNYYTDLPLGTAYSQVATASEVARQTYFLWGGNLEYHQRFGFHSINAIGGYQQELSTVDFTQTALRSMFVKAYYNYKEKYFVEAGVRRDGSSLFAPNYRYGNFPSIALAWNIDKDFPIKGITGWKLRASYGVTGNNKINPYTFQNLISSSGTEVQIANPDIHWEKNNSLDFGTDLFTKCGLSATVDWFDKKTSGVLITPLSYNTAGIASSIEPPINAASIKVNGMEIAINYQKSLSRSFSINGGIGITKATTLVLKVLPGSDQIINTVNGMSAIIQKGQPFEQYYGYKTQGLLSVADSANPAIAKFGVEHPGDIKYVDVNKDGVINQSDMVPLGNTQPTTEFSGHIGFNCAGFDFDMMADGLSGSPLFYNGQFANPFSGSYDATPQKAQLDTWSPTNTGATLPRISAGGNTAFSDFWRRNGEYIRIRYIQLGYTLPSSLVKKIRASMIRIYFNAQNVCTFSHVQMFDPEIPGSTNATVPLLKSYILGLNIKF